MLLDAAILAVIVGLIAGGRVIRLKDLDLRSPWLFVLAAVVQMMLILLAARGVAVSEGLAHALYLASFALLLGAIWANRRLPGVRVVGAGVALNLLVIAANGGSMPVDRELAVRAGNSELVRLLDSPAYVNHTPATAATRLRFLADVLPLPLIVPRPRFFSPGSVGDIFVTIGACWAILAGMGVGVRRARKRGRPSAATGAHKEP